MALAEDIPLGLRVLVESDHSKPLDSKVGRTIYHKVNMGVSLFDGTLQNGGVPFGFPLNRPSKGSGIGEFHISIMQDRRRSSGR